MVFLSFGSSLAHLEPKLQLFEVWKIMVRQIIITSIAMVINFNICNLGSRRARDEPKINHLNTIPNMIGTLVQAQLYTFSSRKAPY